MTLDAAVKIHGPVLHSRKEKQAHSIDLPNVIDLIPINILKMLWMLLKVLAVGQ